MIFLFCDARLEARRAGTGTRRARPAGQDRRRGPAQGQQSAICSRYVDIFFFGGGLHFVFCLFVLGRSLVYPAVVRTWSCAERILLWVGLGAVVSGFG